MLELAEQMMCGYGWLGFRVFVDDLEKTQERRLIIPESNSCIGALQIAKQET